MIRRLFIFFLSFSLALPLTSCAKSKKWDVLSSEDQTILEKILVHWETWVPARKEDGTAPLMNFEELYQGLGEEEQRFLNRVRSIDPRKDFGFRGNFLGTDAGGVKFKRIKGQKILKNGKAEILGPQYLPQEVFGAYKKMMKAMKHDLGKKLLVDSGYRSPAYQLYTFLYFMPKHHDSLVETGHWVALPGYSEHGAPHRQAIDFINEEGVNGEDHPEDFEALPEYEWLLENADRFGFKLSYPRAEKGIIPPPTFGPKGQLSSKAPPKAEKVGGGITFEPWHWRYSKGL